MRKMGFVIVALSVGVATGALGQSSETTLAQLQAREATPAFNRAIVVYQTLREMQENWHNLPSCEPLVEVLDGYQQLIEAADDPAVAAVALDRALQLAFDMLPQDRALSQLRKLDVEPSVQSRSATFGNPPVQLTFGNEIVQLRGLRLGPLEDHKIVSIQFEVRSLTGEAERLALDLRVMNDKHNYQTAGFFDVPASGWQHQETSLEQMFSHFEQAPEYRVLPGHTLVRATFGSVPGGYGEDPHSDVAFENQFSRYYWERHALAQ